MQEKYATNAGDVAEITAKIPQKRQNRPKSDRCVS